ncbi:PREDICTED: uncharacterized protein LOC107349157 [Acropora digitifera]|uniref:uncharacterized protein LOC107349157 n=1 Tax=Acropora digitifera TaxID=70779 RepID=UPI00077AA855|nr:PREDICTED: uncharacterized protein LOC107349157 [Acropora digitifera]
MWLPGVILGFVVIIVLTWLVVRKIRESGEIGRWDALNQEDMQQLVNEIQDVADNVHGMNVLAEHAIKQLRDAADYLDKVWKDCRIASAVGTGANIAGGVLSIAGGTATIMMAGAALPLLVAGAALGVAGSCTNLGTSAVEGCINSSIVKETDEAVRNANRAIGKVQKLFSAIKTGKNQGRLVLMAGIAITMLDKNHLLVKFLKEVVHPNMLAKALPSVMTALDSVKGLAVGAMGKVVSAVEGRLLEDTSKQGMTIGVNVGARTCTSTGAKLGKGTAKNVRAQITAKGAKRVGKRAGAKATQKVGTKVGTKAASKTAAKQAGTVIIGVSAVFLVLDAIDLAMTVRDIVENQGSEAARILRCKADEYEALLDA